MHIIINILLLNIALYGKIYNRIIYNDEKISWLKNPVNKIRIVKKWGKN
jgi:hypothetical protein